MKTFSAILGFFGILAFCEAGYEILTSPMTSLILMLLGLIVMIPTMLISKEIKVKVVITQFVVGVVTFLAINSSVAIADETNYKTGLYQNFVVSQICGYSGEAELYDDQYHRTIVAVHDRCRKEVVKENEPKLQEVKEMCKLYLGLRAMLHSANSNRDTDLCELAMKN